MYNGQERGKNERYKNLPRKGPIVMARFKIRSDEAQEMWSYDWDSVFLMNISKFFSKKFLKKLILFVLNG